jgi:hypothetical protein
MAFVTANDDESEGSGSKPRWSGGKKMDTVLRLLRGKSLDALSVSWGRRASCGAPRALPRSASIGLRPDRRFFERGPGLRTHGSVSR